MQTTNAQRQHKEIQVETISFLAFIALQERDRSCKPVAVSHLRPELIIHYGIAGDGRKYLTSEYRLFGDNDGDGDVDAVDFLAFRNTFGFSSGDPGYNPAFSWDGDSDVDAHDFLEFRSRFGTSI